MEGCCFFFKDRARVGLVMKKLFWSFPPHLRSARPQKAGMPDRAVRSRGTLHSTDTPMLCQRQVNSAGHSLRHLLFLFPTQPPGSRKCRGAGYLWDSPSALLLQAKTVPRGAEKSRADPNLPEPTETPTKPYQTETTQRREGPRCHPAAFPAAGAPPLPARRAG